MEINALTLKALMLAEITRLKYGSSFSLANPKIEKIARHNFCNQVGIKTNAKPTEVLTHIRRVYEENNMPESFRGTIERFKLDIHQFDYTLVTIKK